MVAALSASLFSPSAAGGSSGGGSGGSGKEVAQLKAAILSARSEMQGTACEGDKKKLNDQIQQLETKMRQVQSGAKVEPPARPDDANSTEKPNATDGPNATGKLDATGRLEETGAPDAAGATSKSDADRTDASASTRIRPPAGEPGHLLDISI